MGLALKPDLVAVDPALGHTAEKFVQVLDALEDLEAECEWTDLPGFNTKELGCPRTVHGRPGDRRSRAGE